MHRKPLVLIIASGILCAFAAASASSPQGSPLPPSNPKGLEQIRFTSSGILSPRSEIMPGLAFPPQFSQEIKTLFFDLRDAVYNSAPPEKIEQMASRLMGELKQVSGNPAGVALLEARIGYLAGRAWKEHEGKKQAISWFERGMDAGTILASLEGETPAAILAYTEPLAELCLLKDLGFLMTNGPKIGKNADRILSMEPHNIKGLILKASALAYPPPIWGGNYGKALELYARIIELGSSGLPREILFDIRAGIATAYANLKMKTHGGWWFRSALELYPNNAYAREQMEKLAE